MTNTPNNPTRPNTQSSSIKIIRTKPAPKKRIVKQEPELSFWKQDHFTPKSPTAVRRYVSQVLDEDTPSAGEHLIGFA